MEHKPPKLAEKILTKLQYDDVWKTTLGDFEEYHAHLVEKNGIRAANWWYWKQVLRYAPSKIVHKFYWSIEMFINYLKMSFRRLRNSKTYSFINISGLAVGLASFILIGLFVQHELSYDKHYEDSDRIYRVNKRNIDAYQGNNWNAVTPMPLHSGLKENFPQFEHTTYVTAYTEVIKSGADSFYEDGLYVGGEYFETFSHTWVYGNPTTALDNPESIVLTQSLSRKVFGNKNPVGESISIISAHETDIKLKTVTGVIEDVPRTSHLYFSYIVNEVSRYWSKNDYNNWDSNSYFTYVKLSKQASLNEELQAKLSDYYNAQMTTQSSYNPDKIPQIGFQPMLDIHLKSTHINHQRGVSLGDIKYMYFLLLIGLIILLIACVNYMNLATARAIMRAKEIGVRKVIGALRSNLIMQFISEAVLLSFISIVLALALVRILFPPFIDLVNREIGIDFFTAPGFWLSVLGISFLVGLIAGSYPAFYMSSLRPSGIFKNMTKGGKGNTFMRNALVMGQFSITTILIISSIVIFQQLDYIRTADVGYTRDQILTVHIKDESVGEQYEALAQHLKRNSNIQQVSIGNKLPNNINSSTSGIQWPGQEERITFHLHNVHYDFYEMMDIELIAGRFFSEEFSTDESDAFLLNESAVTKMGLTPEEALGTRMLRWIRDGKVEGQVVGVVKDFSFLSFRLQQEALMVGFTKAHDYKYLVMKVSPDNLQETVAYVEAQVKQVSPNYPFEYAFLDDAFDNMYKTDLNLGTLLSAFTILALFIATIGLFGLASFMMEQRAKEIGIRKVLGANVLQILTVVNKDFMKLIGFSFLIAIPIGWYTMNTWLQDFAYKIELGPSIFIGAIAIAVSVAILTVSYKSIKTATANPVDSLKSE